MSGTEFGTVVYENKLGDGPVPVGLAGGLSPCGTIGQSGNTWEFTESAGDGANDNPADPRTLKGGNWTNDPSYIRARDMRTAGHHFHLSDNQVWLTDHVPPEFIELPQ